MRFFRLGAAVALVFCSSCSSQKPIVVGSKNGVEQRLLAEIAAQQLEHRLQRPVERRLELGETPTVYQALLEGQIGLYPEYSGVVVSDLLKQKPNADAGVVFEFARQEMKRKSLLDYMDPLGFDARTVFVVRAAGNEKLQTASQAAESRNRWKIGVPEESQHRSDSLPELSVYGFQLGAPFRGMKGSELFAAMKPNGLDMLATRRSDGHLLSPEWKVLEDDRHAFPALQAALLVRDDLLTQDAQVRPALAELQGKISLETMRKLDAAVEIDKRSVEDVAKEFLKSAGLD